MRFQTVRATLRETTIAKVTLLREILKSPSKSDTVRVAIEIASLVVKALKRGDLVYIEDAHGTREQLIVPPLNGR